MSEYIISDNGENFGNSSVTMFDISGNGSHNIAENEGSYWISGLILDSELKLMKDTTEGEKLTAMIKSKVGKARIHAYLDRLIIKTMPITDIKMEIENIKQISFEEGKADLKSEFYKLMNLQGN